MNLLSVTEKQKFSQAWLWMLIIFTVLLTTAIFGAGIYVQLIKGSSLYSGTVSGC